MTTSAADVRKRTTRLKKRTSVDVLPSCAQRRSATPKISKTASVGDSPSLEIPGAAASKLGIPAGGGAWPSMVLPPGGELRISTSDSGLHSCAVDPMISMIDHDINSPPMIFAGDDAGEIPAPAAGPGFPPLDAQSYFLPCESMAVDIGTPTVS